MKRTNCFLARSTAHWMLTITAAILLASGAHAQTSVQVKYAWLQLGSDTSASARAIMPAAATGCPSIVIDGSATAMTQRVQSPFSFSDVFVCEYDQLSTASPPQSLKIGPFDLPSLAVNSDQILVIGDTGCRGGPHHDCSEIDNWGWPAISAKAASKTSPDAILHVGDYLYREHCRASDCGYQWSAWDADFFQHAEGNGLLRKAPWIFVRGNHESCVGGRSHSGFRGWHGFFLFFANGPIESAGGSTPSLPVTCPLNQDPYKTSLPDLDIYVVDTSDENSNTAGHDFQQVNSNMAGTSTNTWLATHVPVWNNRGTPDLNDVFRSSGLQKQSWLRWIQVGHVHLFEHYDATQGHQASTINGGSGTNLDSCYTSVDCYDDDYSYMVVDSKSSSWVGSVYNSKGKKVLGPLTVIKH